MMKSACCFALILLVAPVVCFGQETTGSVRGQLRSRSGGAVEAARIEASSPDLLGARYAVSARDGIFQLLALPPGLYSIKIAAIGFRPVHVQDVTVQLGKVTGLREVVLDPAAVALSEITVTAPRVTLDPVRTTIGAVLETADYVGLPAERDHKSLIAILPHVNESARGDPVNAAGSTGLENMYFIDGVNVTSTLKAETGTSLPSNFVRQIEVKTGGYEAQYGRALGAVVNAVTYTGSNRFEGNAFWYFTHDGLTTTPKAHATFRELGSSRWDVGFRLSGPVVRDRLWFSAAYNPRIESTDRELTALGVFPLRQTAHVFAGKLTWQIGTETNLELSVFGDPTTAEVLRVPVGVPTGYAPLNIDPYLVQRETGGLVGSLRSRTGLGTGILLEAVLSRSEGHDSEESPTESGRTQPLFIDDQARDVSGGLGLVSIADLSRTAATLRATWITGRHTVAAGAEFEDVAVFRDFRNTRIRRRATGSQFVALVEGAPGKMHNRVPTAYLQDTWRLTDRLTLSAGVRWSSQTLTGASGRTAQQFPGEWQPRLGVSWQLDGVGRQRAFASLGRFYQQEPLNLSTLWYLDYPFVRSFYSTDPRQPNAVPDSVSDESTLESQYALNVPDLAVEHSDEVTVGYERILGAATTVTARFVRRELRSSFLTGIDPSSPAFWVLGTPGKGDFDFLPPPVRDYTALELSAHGRFRGIGYRASYVLSRNWGNYSGLYNPDLGVASPGGQNTFFAPHQAQNSGGLLPNDRTHMFKLSASRSWGFGLLAGGSATWASGSPMNRFAPGPPGTFFNTYAFVVPRGTAGRTAPVWDLNLRLGFDFRLRRAFGGRVLLDLLHVGNPQRVTWREELAFLENNGTGFSIANPSYGRPIAYQAPMMARLGAELTF